MAFIASLLLVLVWGSHAQGAEAVAAGDTASLLVALQDPRVTSIIMTSDMSLADATPLPHITQRTLSITGACGTSQRCTLDARNASRIFSVGAGGVLALAHVTLTGGSAADNGGAVQISSGGQVTCFSVAMRANRAAAMGGAVYVTGAGSYFSATDSFFGSNSAGERGGVLSLWAGGGASLDACDVSGNHAGSYGGAVFADGKEGATNISANGTLFRENAVDSAGGAICAWNGAVATVEGGTLERNSAANYGGGFFVQDPGTIFRSQGTLFQSNTGAQLGGAGLVAGAASVTLVGARVVNNTTPGLGGGLFLQDQGTSLLITRGSEMRGNSAGSYGGALVVLTGTQAIVEGASVLAGNTAGVSGGAVYAQDAGTTVAVTNGSILADNRAGEDGGGCYAVLAAQCVLEGVALVRNRAGRRGGAAHVEGDGSRLSSSSCRVEDNAALNGGGLSVVAGAHASLLTSSLAKNSATDYGGGLYVAGAGSMVQASSTELAGNGAGRDGGGAALSTGARLVVSDSIVRGNRAGQQGGGLHGAGASTSLACDGCQWEGNQAGGGGGAMYLSQGLTASLNNSQVRSNQAAGGGGGVLLSTSAHLTLASTLFASNVAGDAGGGVALTAGASCLVNSGCMWEDNRAGTMGAALAITDAGSATIVTGATFLRNVATTTGGALAVSAGASCRLQEVSVGYNAAGTAGGGIAVGGSGSQLSVAGGSLDSNRANTSGGGVALASGAAADLDGTRLVGNAAMDGGAVSLIDPATQLRCAGCAMSNNNASRNGGAVFADASLLALDGCTLEGNLASLRGGALFLQGGARCSVLRGRYLGNAAARGGGRVVFAMGRGTVFLSQNSSFSGGSDPAEIIPGSVGVRFVSKDAQACSVEGGHFLGDGVGGSSGDAASMASFNCSEASGAFATAATYAEILTHLGDEFIDIIVLTADISVADAIIVNRSVAISGASCGGGGGCRLGGVGRTRLFTVASYGELILANVSLSGGRAVNGGALHISAGGQAVCDQVAFSGNSAELRGGAVYVTMSPSSFSATKSVFVDNNATVGGAMAFSDSSRSTLQGVLVANCSAGGDGGGIHLDTAAAAIIDNSHVVTCVAGGSGGGLMVAGVGTSVRLVSSVVQGNGGKGNGAGMVVSAGADIEAEASNFVGNVAGGLGGGVRLVGGGTRGIFTGARFLSNRAAGCGGALSVSFAATLRLDSCLLDRNAGKCGGGLHAQDARTVARIRNSTFIGNNATDVGGGVSAFQGPSLELQSCHLSHNRAGSQGGAMFGQGADTRAAVLNSTIASNAAGALGGAVALQSQSVWSGEGALFAGNAAGDSGGALAIGDIGTEASCDHCQFHHNTADQSGAVAYLSSGSLCRFTASVFASNRAEKGSGAGGVARVEGGSTLLRSMGCEYRGNRAATMGGALFLISGAGMDSIGDVFQNNSAVLGGALYADLGSSLNITGAGFVGNDASRAGGAMFASGGSACVATRCVYAGNYAGEVAGAAYVEDASITSNGCVYEGNRAVGDGGALGLYGAAVLTSLNTMHVGNAAGARGGALFVGVGSAAVLVTDNGTEGVDAMDAPAATSPCAFRTNLAQRGVSRCPPPARMPVQRQLRIKGGGGVLWAPINLVIACPDGSIRTANTGCAGWSGNTARYGNNAATSAVTLSIANSTVVPEFIEFRSGQVLATIGVSLLDAYNQEVASEVGALVSVKNAPPGLTGKLLQASVNGRAEFDDLVLTALPGTYTVSFASAGVRGTSVQLRVRACVPGEVRRASNACERCDPPLFSWRPQNRQCELCPPEAICLGGDDVLPLPGYWRSSNVSYEFHACLNENACNYPGREDALLAMVADSTSATWRADAQCDVDQGYRGVLCAECAEGYTRKPGFECKQCPSVALNTAYYVMFMAAGAALYAFMVRETLRWRTDGVVADHLNAAVYIKILVSYCQIMGIAYNYKVTWPPVVERFLGALRNVVTGGGGVFSFECTFRNTHLPWPVIQTLYYALLPLGALLILAVVWIIIYRVQRARGRNPATEVTLGRYFWHRWVVSGMAVFFFIWPAVTDAMLQVFNCYTVDRSTDGGGIYVGKHWESDLGLECYEGDHFWLAFGVAVPTLALFVVGMPLAWVVFMWHHRRALGEDHSHSQYGFLYQDYKLRYFYWECVSMAQKFLLIIVTVFVGAADAYSQLLAALLLLIGFAALHFCARPYLYADKNTLQQGVWHAHCATVALGLWYFWDGFTGGGELVVGTLFVILTVGTMLYLVSRILLCYFLRRSWNLLPVDGNKGQFVLDASIL
eukprot:jgi/Mesvir1/17595/Mv08827-RA.1